MLGSPAAARGRGDRVLLLRVVGHLPGARHAATNWGNLRAGVAQASREETAANATVHAIGNPSASLAYGGVIVGLAIPLGSCLAHSFGLFDLLIWGVVTLLIQLLAFRFADIFLRGLPRRIAEGDVAAAVFLMSIKIGLALIMAGAVADPNVQLFRAG